MADETLREDSASANETEREDSSALQTVPNSSSTPRIAGENSAETTREPPGTMRESQETQREQPFANQDAGFNRPAVLPMQNGLQAATIREPQTTQREPRATQREPRATQREPRATQREIPSPAHRPETPYDANAFHGEGPRVNLPEAVAQHYEWIRDLNVTSGESDVSLIRELDSDNLRFFKRYHRGKYPDENVLHLIREGSSAQHVVRLFDYSSDPNDAWEIQEYCPLGTLGKGSWADEHKPPIEDELIREILSEVAEALHHIHGLESGVAHRDIKPSNILIRSTDPLDLVLTDFGIARDDQSGTHRTTFAGTNLYAAPEAHEGKSTTKSDWFALGAIIFEFITGQKLLADWGNENPSNKEAEVNCLQAKYYKNVDEHIGGEWLFLVQGLVTFDRNYRWGFDEVSQWLRGEHPKVFWSTAGGSFGLSPEECYQPPWSTELIATPQQLASSMSTHWNEARKALTGRERASIKRFLERHSGTEPAIEILDSNLSQDKKILRLQLLLDPEHIPIFIDTNLDTQAIRKQITDANNGNAVAKHWLMEVVRKDVLITFGEHKNDERTAGAGRRLRNWLDQAENVKRLAPPETHKTVDEAFEAELPELFILAFDMHD